MNILMVFSSTEIRPVMIDNLQCSNFKVGFFILGTATLVSTWVNTNVILTCGCPQAWTFGFSAEVIWAYTSKYWDWIFPILQLLTGLGLLDMDSLRFTSTEFWKKWEKHILWIKAWFFCYQ